MKLFNAIYIKLKDELKNSAIEVVKKRKNKKRENYNK